MNAFRIGCVGVQDTWALTASHAPQDGITPLQLALNCGKGEVAKILRKDEDKVLTCRGCKAAFTFTSGEQVFPDV